MTSHGGEKCWQGAVITADLIEGRVRDTLRELLGDSGFTIPFGAGEDLAEVELELQQAEDERVRFATDLEARQLLGDVAWRAGLRERAGAVETAQARYQQVAAQAARTIALPAASELEDSEQLARAIRARIDAIEVRRGHGTVTDRVIVRWAA